MNLLPLAGMIWMAFPASATEQCESVIMAVVGIQIRDKGIISTITLGRGGFTNTTCLPLNVTLESP